MASPLRNCPFRGVAYPVSSNRSPHSTADVIGALNRLEMAGRFARGGARSLKRTLGLDTSGAIVLVELKGDPEEELLTIELAADEEVAEPEALDDESETVSGCCFLVA